MIATQDLNLCFYTSQKYWDRHSKQIDIFSKTENYNFILPHKNMLEKFGFCKFCEINHLNIQPKYETERLDIQNYLVLRGLGIALGFREYIEGKKTLLEIPMAKEMPNCRLNWMIANKERKKEEVKKFMEVM